MGRENRRYWSIDTKTKKKKRITESQYHGEELPWPESKIL